jgi:hypothetical protein
VPTWHLVPVAVATPYHLHAISAIAPNDVWAAGDQSLLHWDGQNFQPVSLPTPAGLGAISAGSSTSVWAVGSYYSLSPLFSPYAAHWDGTQWHTIVGPADQLPKAPNASSSSYNDVAAAGPEDAYMTGGVSYNANNTPFFVHCTTAACNGIALSTSDYGFVWGVSAPAVDDVWITGFDSVYPGYSYVGRWTGSGPVTEVFTSSTRFLTDVAALSADDVWVAGYMREDSSSLLQHWDGSTWTVVSSPNIGPLNGVVARSSSDVWAFGNGVLHWNGSAWTQVPGLHSTTVTDLSPLGADDVWVVGRDANDNTLIEHYAALATFSDVPLTDTFAPYIEWMTCRAIIGGYACGGAEPCDGYNRPYFRPGNGVSRGQMLKMVTLAAGWPLLNPATATFADVPRGSTFYQAIETGFARGIVVGYTCGGPGEPCDAAKHPYFRPAAGVTRGQLSKILALARAYPLPTPATATFADVPPGSTFYGYVESVAAQGIVSGYPCGSSGEPCDGGNRPYFRPTVGATRAQVSQMVTRAYGGP